MEVSKQYLHSKGITMWSAVKGFFVEEVPVEGAKAPKAVVAPQAAPAVVAEPSPQPKVAPTEPTDIQPNADLIQMLREETATGAITAAMNAFKSLEAFIPDADKRWEAALVTAGTSPDMLVLEYQAAARKCENRTAEYVASVQKQCDSEVAGKRDVVDRLKMKETELRNAHEDAVAHLEKLSAALVNIGEDITAATAEVEQVVVPFTTKIRVFQVSANALTADFNAQINRFTKEPTNVPE